MSARSLPVILYHYDASPFATKVKNMLLAKRIPHKRVNVTMIMPRPALSEQLGITYRKIPVLAIGNDVYCDTSLIATALERRFPASEGYGTLFPPRKGSDKADTGVAMAVMMYWMDRVMFPLAANSLPYHKYDAEFLKDRHQWMGAPIDAKALAAKQPQRTSALASHMTLLEQQLADDRDWLLDTTTPGLADIAAHFVCNWVRIFRSTREVFDPKVFPKSMAWIARVSEALDKLQKDGAAPFDPISGEEAAKLVCSSPEQPNLLRFDQTEANRFQLQLGEPASVAPTDSGRVPTVGKLLGLTTEEAVIETEGKAGRVHCHFPRLNFSVKTAQTAAKL
ncbi:hypothetical protein EIP91_003513 [Steccherinum ochraceum]|uniref:GST N-terminal domain-containing protein n=1 Tax=Steccherinum ochraceum TaxID=92696 RepID=A0A4R0RT81_9APHY|nr:hypothetical protein EIP91_003513 [Steccherinum ochraceum]